MLICLFQKTVRGRLSVISKKGVFYSHHTKNKYPKNIIVVILSNVCIIGMICRELFFCHKRTLLWKYISKRKHTSQKQQQNEKITPSGVVQHTYTFAPIPIVEEITYKTLFYGNHRQTNRGKEDIRPR